MMTRWGRSSRRGLGRLGVAALLAAALLPIGATAPAQAQRPMVLHLGNGPDPETLDPHRLTSITGDTITRDLCEGLVALDNRGEVTPGLAERWDISEDGKTYTFHLRDGLKWSDGSPFRASEFVWSFQRSLAPATKPGFPEFLYAIRNAREITAGALPPDSLAVHAPDDRTVVIELWRPFPDFLNFGVAQRGMFPLQQAAVERHGIDFVRPGNFHCTGAFILDAAVPQSHFRLVKNPYYWDAANVRADVVYRHSTENPDTEVRRFRAGELHMTNTVSATQLDWLRTNMPDALRITPAASTYYFLPNYQNAPWQPDNVALRQALAMAIDRQALVSQVTRGGEVPAFTVSPPTAVGYTPPRPDWADWPRDKQIAEARRLYAEAGYGPNNPLRIEIMFNTMDRHRQIAIAVGAMWRQVLGVDVVLNNVEWKVLLDRMRTRNYPDLLRRTWIANFAFSHLDLFRSDAQPGAGAGWADPAFDALMAESETIADPAAYKAKLAEAEALLLESTPIIPILHDTFRQLVSPRLRGYEGNATNTHPAKYMWLE